MNECLLAFLWTLQEVPPWEYLFFFHCRRTIPLSCNKVAQIFLISTDTWESWDRLMLSKNPAMYCKTSKGRLVREFWLFPPWPKRWWFFLSSFSSDATSGLMAKVSSS